MSYNSVPVLPDWLDARSTEQPNSIAVESGKARWTYLELRTRALRVSRLLHDVGVNSGDRVGLLARSGLSICQAVHGIFQRQAVVVPLNIRLTTTELLWQIRDADVSCLVYDDAFSPTIDVIKQSLAADGKHVNTINLERVNVVRRDEPIITVRDGISLDAPAGIIYTSGTSGNAKGCVLTYGNFWWSAMASALQFGLSKQERWLVPMPLFHVGGLSVLIRSAIYGTTAVVHDTFDETEVNRALVEDHITCVSVVPTMLTRMLRAKDKPYGSELRFVLLGGSGVSEQLLLDCIKEGVPVAPSYGLSESSSQAVTLSPCDVKRKLGSSGRPLLPNRLRIVRDNGEAAAPNEHGEITLSGPTITSGYLNNVDATQAAIVDGWLMTGDYGYVDQDGYLYVLDRRSDLIVSGGENIYPAEVERVILQHPAILEAGVAPAADPLWGQVPVAYIVIKPTMRVETGELTEFCRARLAHYKVPKQVRVVEELPRNASGKLLRRTLRTWL